MRRFYALAARPYDPALCRFIAPDPAPARVGMPTTLDRYLYAADNPVSYIDPDGLDILLGNYYPEELDQYEPLIEQHDWTGSGFGRVWSPRGCHYSPSSGARERLAKAARAAAAAAAKARAYQDFWARRTGAVIRSVSGGRRGPLDYVVAAGAADESVDPARLAFTRPDKGDWTLLAFGSVCELGSYTPLAVPAALVGFFLNCASFGKAMADLDAGRKTRLDAGVAFFSIAPLWPFDAAQLFGHGLYALAEQQGWPRAWEYADD